MSETASQEPTMEEILASIRRIISEDEPPAEVAAEPEAEEAEPAAVEAEAAPEPVVAEAAPAAAEEDVLELTEPLKRQPPQVAAAETIGDLEVTQPEPKKARAALKDLPEPQPAARVAEDDDGGLVSGSPADAASNAFGQLAQRIAMPAPAATLDDVVRELLRPLLKEWLERNLPAIVQAKVEEEVERLARRRMS